MVLNLFTLMLSNRDHSVFLQNRDIKKPLRLLIKTVYNYKIKNSKAENDETNNAGRSMREQFKYITITAVTVIVATVFAIILNYAEIGRENVLLVYTVGVLVTAYFTEGYRYGIYSSIMCVMAFNYLFTEPYRDFSIANKNDMVLLFFFLLTALIGTNLSVRFQKQVKIATKLSKERERIKYAMEKEQLRSNLLRSISHDLRTPLTGIAGASALMMNEKTSKDAEVVRSLAEDINEQVDWLSQIIENILNMTRIESGNLEINRQAEAVEDLLNNALTGMKGRGGKREIQVEIPEDIIMIEVDGRLIVQVLVNFLDNAIKNTHEDGRIRLKVVEEGNMVWFCCEDNGRGIKEEILPTMFDEFVTDKAVNQDSGRGIGLGLAICKAIVQAHGGKIEAVNKEEGGACVRFGIPYGGEKQHGKGNVGFSSGG